MKENEKLKNELEDSEQKKKELQRLNEVSIKELSEVARELNKEKANRTLLEKEVTDSGNKLAESSKKLKEADTMSVQRGDELAQKNQCIKDLQQKLTFEENQAKTAQKKFSDEEMKNRDLEINLKCLQETNKKVDSNLIAEQNKSKILDSELSDKKAQFQLLEQRFNQIQQVSAQRQNELDTLKTENNKRTQELAETKSKLKKGTF